MKTKQEEKEDDKEEDDNEDEERVQLNVQLLLTGLELEGVLFPFLYFSFSVSLSVTRPPGQMSHSQMLRT